MREPIVLLGFPLEPYAVARPGWFAGCCGALFVLACYVAEALLNGAGL
jgi:hypothetical protein